MRLALFLLSITEESSESCEYPISSLSSSSSRSSKSMLELSPSLTSPDLNMGFLLFPAGLRFLFCFCFCFCLAFSFRAFSFRLASSFLSRSSSFLRSLFSSEIQYRSRCSMRLDRRIALSRSMLSFITSSESRLLLLLLEDELSSPLFRCSMSREAFGEISIASNSKEKSFDFPSLSSSALSLCQLITLP